MCHKNNFSDKANNLFLSHICALYIFNVSFCQLFSLADLRKPIRFSLIFVNFYRIPSIPSIRALMVWITIFCSFGCRFKTRETILWAGFLSPSGFFPNNSFASAPSTSTSFTKSQWILPPARPQCGLLCWHWYPLFLQEFPGINDSLFSFVEHVLLTGSAPVNPHGFPTQSPFASQERDLKHSAVNSTFGTR